MAPGTNTVMKLFRGSTSPGQSRVATKVPRLSRRSSGLAELAKLLNSEAYLYVLDLGYTSPSNIRYFTERGHKIYSEDLLVASTDPALLTKDEAGNSVPDEKQFLADNLVYPNAQFDLVLCWNMADYMEEALRSEERRVGKECSLTCR